MQLKFFLVILFSSISFFVDAQDQTKGRPSPPKELKTSVGSVNIIIKYNAPSVKGREIWGKLVPYKKVWRTGANEATTFECDGDLKVQGQLLPKGKYALFTIPDKSEWIIIFHSNPDQWGNYEYKQDGDVIRVNAVPVKRSSSQEQLLFSSSSDGISIDWEEISVPLTIKQ
jgi:hypothetical protein